LDQSPAWCAGLFCAPPKARDVIARASGGFFAGGRSGERKYHGDLRIIMLNIGAAD
jgi:hypothetical protein